MKKIPKLVPWVNDDEFNTIFKWLYSPPGHPNRLRGVKRVKAWLCRGKVPHSVIATSHLVQVVERELSNQTAPIEYRLSQLELRLMFSTAFIRFIGGITDAERKGVYMTSVSAIAERMNLPLWWVDLRHQATHESVPSLSQLKEAVYKALDWLKNNYWDIPETNMISDDEVVDAINKYKLTRKQYLKGIEVDTLKESFIDFTPGSDVITDLLKRVQSEAGYEQLSSILLQPGFLVPQRKRKRQSIEDLDVSLESLAIWKPLLLQLNSNIPNFMDDLVQIMLKEIIKDQVSLSKHSMILLGYFNASSNSLRSLDSSELSTYVAWIIQLMKWDLMVKKKIGFGIDWDEIQSTCLENPNLYTFTILKSMSDSDETINTKLENCLPLINDFIQTTNPNDSSSSKSPFNLESEKQDVERIVKKLKQNNPNGLDSPINFDNNAKCVPFGSFSNTQLPDLNLPLEYDKLPAYIPAYQRL